VLTQNMKKMYFFRRTQPMILCILTLLNVSVDNGHHRAKNTGYKSKVKYNASISTLWNRPSLAIII
jgi:hypothetical protein